MSFRNCSWPFPLRRLLLPSIHPGDVGDSLGPRIAGQVGHICLNLEGHHETSVRNHLGGEPQCSSLARYTPTPIKPCYAPADRQKVGLRQIASKLATAGKALQIPFFPAIPCDERDRDRPLIARHPNDVAAMRAFGGRKSSCSPNDNVAFFSGKKMERGVSVRSLFNLKPVPS